MITIIVLFLIYDEKIVLIERTRSLQNKYSLVSKSLVLCTLQHIYEALLR